MNIYKLFKDKKVLITGNTGFKGSWLSIYLHHLGAKIIGVSLKPHIEMSMHNYCRLEDFIEQYYINISDYDRLLEVIKVTQPDYIFHMAAQAITLTAYKEPRKTFETNVMGTVNILESVMKVDLHVK
ncbi:MAG: GDP-mannose 4,6-dehydratase [Chitinophagales bacterium]